MVLLVSGTVHLAWFSFSFLYLCRITLRCQVIRITNTDFDIWRLLWDTIPFSRFAILVLGGFSVFWTLIAVLFRKQTKTHVRKKTPDFQLGCIIDQILLSYRIDIMQRCNTHSSRVFFEKKVVPESNTVTKTLLETISEAQVLPKPSSQITISWT
jgi:hypothetical protein